MQEREKKLVERVDLRKAQLEQRRDAREALPHEAAEKLAACTTEKRRQRTELSYAKRIARAQRQLELAHERLAKAEMALGKLRVQKDVNSERRSWNLGTSLKSYIDPRVCYQWGQQVDYDVLARYYPKTLQRRFAWVRIDEGTNELAFD
jgi:DNA topoisomerase-1